MSQQLEQEVKANLESRWDSVIAVQESLQMKNGRFSQQLWSHSEPPKGVPTSLNRSKAKPHYQEEDWESSGAVGILGDTPRVRARIDTYEGPLGSGFFLTMQYMDGNQLRSVVKSHGPETYWDRDWKDDN